MKRPFLVTVSMLLSQMLLIAGLAYPQSGRSRPPASTPAQPETPAQRTPQPAPSGPVPAGGKVIKQQTEEFTSRFEFQNGLTLLVKEDHSRPLAAALAYVKAGSFDDPEGATGLSRLTAQVIASSVDSPVTPMAFGALASLGDNCHVDAGMDHTSFSFTVPVRRLDEALALQANALIHPAISSDSITKYAARLVTELNSEADIPSLYAERKLYATAFQQHSARRLSGVASGALTREQVQSFYQANYQPKNVILSVTGDVRITAVLQRAQRLFGEWSNDANKAAQISGSPASASVASEPPQTSLRYAEEKADLAESIVSIGYRMPEIKSKETPAVQVLTALLGLGRGARLRLDLHDGSGLISSASANYLGLPELGYLTIQLELPPAKINDAEAAYFNEIERLRRELASPGELQRAVAQLEIALRDNLSTLQGKSLALARYQVLYGDFRKVSSQVETWRQVTAEQVQQVAAKYLTLSDTTVFEYEAPAAAPRTFPSAEAYADTVRFWAPKSQAANVGPNEVHAGIAIKPASEGQTGAEGPLGDVIPQPIKSYATLHGPRVFVREDHSQPTVTVGLYFEGGRLVESAKENGLTELTLRMMLRGTKDHPSSDLVYQIEQLGGQLNIVNEPDFYGFTLDVLSRNAEVALPLLVSLVEHPTFDKTQIGPARDGQIVSMRLDVDNRQSRTQELFWHSLFPSHPYGLTRFGDEAVIRAATIETVQGWYAKIIQRQLPLAIIVGDTEGSGLVGRYLSDGFNRRDLDQTFKAPVPTVAATKPAVDQRGRRTTTQIVGFAAPTGTSQDYYAIELLQGLTGSRIDGIDGIDDTRRDGGETTDGRTPWDYAAAGRMDSSGPADFSRPVIFYEGRLVAGAIGAYLISSPDNEAAAPTSYLAMLQRLATQDLTDEALATGRTLTANSYDIALQRHSSQLLEYARAVIFKRPPEQVDNFADQLQGIGKDDIKRVAAAIFKPNQVGIGVIRGTAKK